MADQPTPEETYGYTFAPGDRVIVAEGAARADGYIGSELRRILKGDGRAVVTEKADFDGDFTITPEGEPNHWTYVHPRHLTLVAPEPTDQPATPQQRPTPEQRAAVEWLRSYQGTIWNEAVRQNARTLLDALPATLTAPQPELPSEPGAYLANTEEVVLLGSPFHGAGQWTDAGGQVLHNPHALAPFTRLVPERPAITREQIARLVNAHRVAVLTDHELITELVALANGTDR